jgi:hypothetical protein
MTPTRTENLQGASLCTRPGTARHPQTPALQEFNHSLTGLSLLISSLSDVRYMDDLLSLSFVFDFDRDFKHADCDKHPDGSCTEIHTAFSDLFSFLPQATHNGNRTTYGHIQIP